MLSQEIWGNRYETSPWRAAAQFLFCVRKVNMTDRRLAICVGVLGGRSTANVTISSSPRLYTEIIDFLYCSPHPNEISLTSITKYNGESGLLLQLAWKVLVQKNNKLGNLKKIIIEGFWRRPGICINLEVVILGILHQLFLKIKENQQKLMTISFFINLT